jgi:hypothetical protein
VGILRDERGKPSLARVLLVVVVAYTLTLIAVDAALHLGVGTSVWGLLSAMVIAFAAWAGGPRALQYLGPQIGSTVAGITSGKRTSREPDLYKDDEK